MRAISLWQPWAAGIAIGHKSIETRHWSTNYRGPLLIHAAKRFGPEEREFASVERTLGRLPERLPLGAYIAITHLVDVRPTEELALEVGPIEKLYGNYEPGRYGWILERTSSFPPVPAKGRQGFWTPSEEEIAAVRASIQECVDLLDKVSEALK